MDGSGGDVEKVEGAEEVTWTVNELLQMEEQKRSEREAAEAAGIIVPDTKRLKLDADGIIYPDTGNSQESDATDSDDDEETLINLRTRDQITALNESVSAEEPSEHESLISNEEMESLSGSEESEDDSMYGKLREIYAIHRDSVTAEVYDKYGRNPTMDEFWTYYINQYAEPADWIGIWYEHQWSQKKWPIPMTRKGYVQATGFCPTSLYVTAVLLGPDGQAVDTDDKTLSGLETVKIPLWEVTPVKEVEGAIINIRTFREAVLNYRSYRVELSLPFDSSTADFHSWFRYGKSLSLNLCHDLEFPGALSNTMHDEIVSLICSIRPLERELSEIRAVIQLDEQIGEEDEACNEAIEKQAFIEMELGRLGNRLKYLSSPILRSMIESRESKMNAEGAVEAKKYELVVVLCDGLADFNLLEKIKNVAGTWLQSDVALQNFKIVKNLETAVSIGAENGVILIGPGDYTMTHLGCLENGGKLIGVPHEEKEITVAASGTGNVWMLLRTGTLHLQNIHFVIKDGFNEQVLRTAIRTLKGCVDARDCSFVNVGGEEFGLRKKFGRQTVFAFEMLGASEIKLSKSSISGFMNAIDLFDTKVSVTDSIIKNCYCAISLSAENHANGNISNVSLENIKLIAAVDQTLLEDAQEDLCGENCSKTAENVLSISNLSIEKLQLSVISNGYSYKSSSTKNVPPETESESEVVQQK